MMLQLTGRQAAVIHANGSTLFVSLFCMMIGQLNRNKYLRGELNIDFFPFILCFHVLLLIWEDSVAKKSIKIINKV